MNDLDIYKRVRRDALSGAGISIQVRAVVWMLDALAKGYGDQFSISRAIGALNGLADRCGEISRELERASRD